ncbi:MAG: hypothetical protein ACJAW4_001681 [Paracoccaceae bacterium]
MSTKPAAVQCSRAIWQQSHLAERAGQKIVFWRQFSELGMTGHRVDGWFRIQLGLGIENT